MHIVTVLVLEWRRTQHAHGIKSAIRAAEDYLGRGEGSRFLRACMQMMQRELPEKRACVRVR